MTANPPSVQPATPDEHAKLASVLVDAFQEDPLARWLYPDPQVRRASHVEFFTRAIANLGADGFIDKTPTGDAVALWRKVEDGADKGPNDDEPLWETRPAAAEFFAAVDAAAPRPPYLYLAFLAAKNAGCGAGSALLRRRAGTSGGRLALWTANPRNLGFYERRGFSVFSGVVREGAQAWWLTHGF